MATSQVVVDLTNLKDDEENVEQEDEYDPRDILEPVITRIVDALGGVEDGEYRMGEQVGACLKDLKKLWRRDDVDDDRTVARIFWERRLLQNDLVPILLATAGKGLGDDKRAIACVDLMTAMTWPIDLAEELKELDEAEDKNADFTHLLASHLHYKATLVGSGVLTALFNIVVPPLSKSPAERTERDCQLVTVVLYLIRNLAFVKDLRPGANLSAQQLEFTSLQSRLIKELSAANFIEFIITIAANTQKDPWLTSWNTIALEILYLFYRGISPASLATKQVNQPREKLKRLLNTEARLRRDVFSNTSTRHSRFGTTIAVILNPNKKRNSGDPQPHSSVLHRQQALNKEAVEIMDIKKRQRAHKGNTVDELSREDNLSIEARVTLQELAKEFLRACFNPFVSTLLRDIRLERARVTEKDKLRLLFLTNFFLEYFLALRAQEEPSQPDKTNSKNNETWSFGLVTEVIERDWIVWVLKRMREAVDEKPKLWTELQAGIECLTQLLLLVDTMSKSDISDPTLTESADILQQQIIYNGDILDIALDSLRAYRQGSQSLAYLSASVYLAYALMRILERWTKDKGDGVYVRKKTVRRKRKAKGITEEEGIPDADEEEEVERYEDTIQETLFTFDAFEMKFASAEISQTLLTYLARYREFESPDNMRRVVSLLHRQAVKAKAEGLFFNVSTLDLFKTILSEKDSLPRDQPYKDLVNLINFILRKFFKALNEDTFLAVEAFFPKNRGHWKQYSSWKPEERGKKAAVEDHRFPPEIQVKKGYSWGDQIGIIIATIVEAAQIDLVTWTKEILATTRDQRRKIIDETDDQQPNDNQSQEGEGGDGDVDTTLRKDRPSAEALDKIKDYVIPYLDDERANAATKNPQLKLLFRLCKFAIQDEDEDEIQWYIPAAILPSELQGMINVINQFLETPFDLEGKKASSLLSKKRRRHNRRRRRGRTSSPEPDEDNVLDEDEDEGDDDDDGERGKKRKEKKKKEKEQYKSAQFIEDSDEEYGDMESFLEKEKTLRQKAAALAGAEAVAAASSSSQGIRPLGMKAHGTKKRRQKDKEITTTTTTTTRSRSGEKKKKKRTHDTSNSELLPSDNGSGNDGRSWPSEAEVDSDDDVDGGTQASPSSSITQPVLPRPPHQELPAAAAWTAAAEGKEPPSSPPLKSPAEAAAPEIGEADDDDDDDATPSLPAQGSEWQRRARRIVIASDDEE